MHFFTFPMSWSIHISCLPYSVAPHNPCGFSAFLEILHHLQTILCNCLLLLSFHLHIIKALLVSKLIPMVLHFSLLSIQIFHPLLLFSFSFLPGSLPSSSLMFPSILQCVPASIVISCAKPCQMTFLSLNICNLSIHLFLVLYS